MGGYIQFRAGARSAPTVRCWSRAFFEIAPLSLGAATAANLTAALSPPPPARSSEPRATPDSRRALTMNLCYLGS